MRQARTVFEKAVLRKAVDPDSSCSWQNKKLQSQYFCLVHRSWTGIYVLSTRGSLSFSGAYSSENLSTPALYYVQYYLPQNRGRVSVVTDRTTGGGANVAADGAMQYQLINNLIVVEI